MNSNLQKDINMIMDSILNSIEKENEVLYGDIAEKIIENSKTNIKEINKFDIMVKYKIENALRVLIKKLNPEIIDNSRISKIEFLYLNYKFLENNIRNFIIQKEGNSFCADKTRWIIRQYKQYILENTIPDMAIEEKCYWKPSFGTGEQWMKFCESLYKLYYGRPSEYLLILKEFI